MLLQVDKLIPEVSKHYPNEPKIAAEYLRDTYNIDIMTAIHLVSVIWSHLHMLYPLNLPNFLINPYGIYSN